MSWPAVHVSSAKAYTSVTMHRRLIAIALLLITVLQVPALAYSAIMNAGVAEAHHACGGFAMPEGKTCDTCCSEGSMQSCATHCLLPVGATLVQALPSLLRMPTSKTVIPDAGVTAFTDHAPQHPFRPPIL